ncbi:flagellar export chaperone FliS [Paenibacillus radicis (ex Xue et al. 2023)]|uniref:Flagellar secretion chaperone FliS n=1 Tax=Paenibacillus radicis (ex Xue et al. 2023) TaxID=2972489 RepID=A0ABT1YGS5_9BACL|nr:flagellar export chaperone FliS [Paenibacillus radicis (ex Xue et al. 2023)]MCR8632394.1 flagellar export chaperone FliS [Paenibacillus radicis (ex Xue et al. 2023)]
MINNPQANKYLENAIQTASPAQLLIMLCDGAIRFSKLAIQDIQKQQYVEANLHINKVQDIINEFIITLDNSSPVAEGLLRLYDYFLYRLLQANTKKEVEPIEEVIQYFVELKETWIQAAKASNAVRPTAGTQA